MVEEHAASMRFVQTFLESSVKEEAQKIQFLQTISTLSEAARDEGFSQELKEFYHRFEVAENIEELLEEEPMDHLHTAVRQEAMLALANMSKVEMALGGMKKSLLEACFRSVFLLPPKTDMQGLDSSLYFDTLDAMDILLKSLVLSSPGCGELKSILQMLLPFTDMKNAAACERAVVRIGKLADLMDSSSSVQVWSLLGDDNSSSHGDAIHDRLLGQLLGHLIVCWTSKIWEIQREALDALHYFCRFIHQEKCKRSCVGLRPSAHRHLLIVLLVSPSIAVDSFCTCWRMSRKACPLPSPPLALTAAFPQHPSYRFAAEAECSPQVQSCAALLPTLLRTSQNPAVPWSP
ncbi:maestro heat-like repeat-containing protein family member 7 [Neopsephotus bourkii]|uniref:maestro heat-like repeat-containing protein family member 7 n=1 Tax=Neopsephotus bourkii TaxID=309878 RepID=UPI002AA56772|nr:maestro heat-like repeat-containing protein family member 7 [Neopsephotus bourkii]XP_061235969.1 maestro heat-like repeat-containing protein family member 7 [Neopsephotus bourkii]